MKYGIIESAGHHLSSFGPPDSDIGHLLQSGGSEPGIGNRGNQWACGIPVELSAALLDLTEKLAENAHDHWGKLRIEQGWTWGAERNDASKQHPDLIPYNELPDTEKEYERQSAMETLKAIIALGYRIEPHQ